MSIAEVNESMDLNIDALIIREHNPEIIGSIKDSPAVICEPSKYDMYEQIFNTELVEHRCQYCNRLLGKFLGQAEIKCPKCGKINRIGVKRL